MADNIVLPAVPVLNEIDDSTKLLIEQAGEINRYPISDLDIGGGDVTIDLNSPGGDSTNTGNPINADTLGGKPASDYVLKDELILDGVGGGGKGDITIEIDPSAKEKPQSPLYSTSNDTYIYPLTTADQVIMPDGSRLNKLATPKAGFIYPLASSAVPEGFLLCDGTAYSKTEYPELFAAIGTIYGSGDGSTTFNVPNLQTRVPVGAGSGYELGTTGGEEKHTLTVEEMPSHDHYLPMYVSTGNSKPGASVGYSENCGGTQWATSGYVGNSQPHNNMQPYTVVNYIIATGKNTGVSVQDVIAGAQALPLGIEYGGTGATNAETARDNLGITPENIGAMSMELLWENASPSSDFGAQTLTLNLDGYSAIDVVFRAITTRNYYATFRVYLNGQIYECLDSDGTGFMLTREVEKTAGGLRFSNGYKYDSYAKFSQNASVMIPYQIYGIKGVSA